MKKFFEFARFFVSGGICFLIELGILTLLKEKFTMDTLIATPIAFLFSVAANYLFCVLWVFQGANKKSKSAKSGFLFTSAVGLLLNELLMFLFRSVWGEDAVLFVILGWDLSLYKLNKAFSTLIVMVWNYYTKRLVLKGIQKKNHGGINEKAE